MSNPYVEINQPLLTSIPKELGKLANSLAAGAREVGFFKNAQKCAGHQNWRRSQQERIQQPHSSVMQRSMDYLLPFHKDWKRRNERLPSAMGLTHMEISRRSLFM